MTSQPVASDPRDGTQDTNSRIMGQPGLGCQAMLRRNTLVSNGLALAAAVVLAAVSTACGGRSAVPRPFPTPGGTARSGVAAPASPFVESLLRTATDLLGTPYRNGGSTTDGFDCSGFVQYVYAQQGVRLPRTVRMQAETGSRVRQPEAGDLVFFKTEGRKASHVGIALGPDRFIHAPSSKGVVRVEPFASSYWADRFVEARRVD